MVEFLTILMTKVFTFNYFDLVRKRSIESLNLSSSEVFGNYECNYLFVIGLHCL